MSMRWRYLWAAWEVAAALSLSAALCAGVVELVIGHHWIWLAVAAPGLVILAIAVVGLVLENSRVLSPMLSARKL